MDGPWRDSAKWTKSHRERLIPYDLTYMWNFKTKPHRTEKEIWRVVSRGRRWEQRESGEAGQKAPASRCQMSESWGGDRQHGDSREHCCATCRKEVKRVNPRSSRHEEQTFPFILLSFLFVVSEKMDVSWTSCGNHFTICVNRVIMLDALNVCSDWCISIISQWNGKNNFEKSFSRILEVLHPKCLFKIQCLKY